MRNVLLHSALAAALVAQPLTARPPQSQPQQQQQQQQQPNKKKGRKAFWISIGVLATIGTIVAVAAGKYIHNR